jgi:flagellar hook-associated protein FlgK
VKQFGLNAQESAIIHARAQTLNALLTQLRQSSQAIVNGKKNLAASDATALSALADQRDQLINTLANEILNAVRPETAARLRAPGHVVAASATQGQGGK